MTNPNTPPRNRVRRGLPDKSLAAANAAVTILSVTSDAPGPTVKITFSGPVTYAGTLPPQSWTFNGIAGIAYQSRTATSCRITLPGPCSARMLAVVAAGDPAIRTAAGGFVSGYVGTITQNATEVLNVILSGDNQAYWKFSNNCIYKAGGPLTPEACAGLKVKGQSPTIAWLDNDEIFCVYATPLNIGDQWSTTPASNNLAFSSGAALATSAGNVISHAKDVIVTRAWTDNAGDYWIEFSDQVYWLGGDITGIQYLADDSTWKDLTPNMPNDDFTTIYSSGGDDSAHLLRVVAPVTGFFYVRNIVTPQTFPAGFNPGA